MTVLMNPDCLDQKHRACSGDGFCEATENAVPCPCSCHAPAEHFPFCPCGACQGIRAAQPVAAAMQARHLSGASIGKLVEWEVGKSLTTGERQWSPIATLAVVSHGHEETNLTLQWDDYGLEETTLHPDDWVRVTAPAATGQEAA